MFALPSSSGSGIDAAGEAGTPSKIESAPPDSELDPIVGKDSVSSGYEHQRYRVLLLLC